MIDKREILEAASALGLLPNVVEKDYVLGWLRRPTRSRTAWTSTGPTYIYRCPFCDKTFRRKTMDSTLNPHKDASGRDCPGRRGRYEDTRY